MMQKYCFNFLLLAIALIASFSIAACGKMEPDELENFDRKTMLQNLAANLIKPAFLDLQLNVNDLKKSIETLNSVPNTDNLELVKSKWTAAYSAWQFANGYNFGPAGEDGLRKGLIEEIGTFPINTTKIESFIVDNDTAFQNFARDTRGFLAIEYLVFSPGALMQLQVEANRRNYLSALSNHLKTHTDFVVNEWISGTYAGAFIADNATSVGSSTSNFYNEFIKNYEALKNFKIALPLGKRAGQSISEPEKVEAYFSGMSIDMLKLHFEACENIWHGKSKSGVDGIGFKEYLDAVEGGKALITSTEQQIFAIKKALSDIPTNQTFSQLIESNDPSIFELQVESQKMVRFFKSDLSSLLGIAITFSSGDGD